ncbi:hypothetical protein ABVT39_026081 [Epinephelus coioides]
MRAAGEQGSSPDFGYKPGLQVKESHRQDHTATMRSLVFVLLIGAACECEVLIEQIAFLSANSLLAFIPELYPE